MRYRGVEYRLSADRTAGVRGQAGQSPVAADNPVENLVARACIDGQIPRRCGGIRIDRGIEGHVLAVLVSDAVSAVRTTALSYVWPLPLSGHAPAVEVRGTQAACRVALHVQSG